MQDLQQQSAMLQKEYEYEKELYRQQTREAGIPKRSSRECVGFR